MYPLQRNATNGKLIVLGITVAVFFFNIGTLFLSGLKFFLFLFLLLVNDEI